MISKNLTLLQKFVLKNARRILLINLLGSFLLGFLVHSHLAEVESEKTRVRHEKLIQDFYLAFDQYLHPLEGILSTLHYSNLKITPESFRTAAESRNLFKNFDAALGIGFVRYVKPSELPSFLANQKKSRQDFHLKRLKPEKDILADEDYFITELIEPSEKNVDSIGNVL